MMYSKFANQEKYLFEDVSRKFKTDGYLDAFDFFFIIIWKANRAKSKIAEKLIMISKTDDLDEACKRLTSSIFKARSNKEKLRILLDDWNFRLPMASAVLTVLYPDDFTVYDMRVCKILEKYDNLKDKKGDVAVKGYFEFLEDVKEKVPEKDKLREKDHFLWGKSFCEDLKEDIKNRFRKDE